MRIAIPLEGTQVAQHMGHCPAYLIAEVNEDKSVASTSEHTNPRHGPGGPPPVFLKNLGVAHVVGWGAPPHFLNFISQLGISYTLGARGEAQQVLRDFLAGTLQLTQEGLEVSCGHDHGHDHDHDHDHGH